MQVKMNSYNQNFCAKFLKTDTLQDVVDYAVNHNKFDKLNQARKNIEEFDYFSKISVEIKSNPKNDRKNFVFTSYIPSYELKNGKVIVDYKATETTYPSQKNNVIKELYEKIIKMGNNVPENNLYKKIVRNR